jgi:hypothetical protein
MKKKRKPTKIIKFCLSQKKEMKNNKKSFRALVYSKKLIIFEMHLGFIPYCVFGG